MAAHNIDTRPPAGGGGVGHTTGGGGVGGSGSSGYERVRTSPPSSVQGPAFDSQPRNDYSVGVRENSAYNQRVVNQFCLADGVCWQSGPVEGFCCCLPLREGTGVLATWDILLHGLWFIQQDSAYGYGWWSSRAMTASYLALTLASLFGLYGVLKYHEQTAQVYQYSWPARIIFRGVIWLLAGSWPGVVWVLLVWAVQLYCYKVTWSFYQEVKYVRAQARALAPMDSPTEEDNIL